MPEVVVYFCQCGKSYRHTARFIGRSAHCAQCRSEYVVPEGPLVSLSDEDMDSSQSENTQTENSNQSTVSIPKNDSSVITVAMKPPGSPMQPKKYYLGKYRIHEKIGRGGMGSVYAAWDTELQREICVKILNSRGRKSPNAKERFINEARITGKLEHSGIVPIYYLDYDSSGIPFYAMRILEGRTLAQLIEQYHQSRVTSFSPETLRGLLRHFINVCMTIAYAHDHFVIHRDIKPKNIMLGGYGETMVIDWGLAKVVSRKGGAQPDIDDFPDEILSEEKFSEGKEGLTIVGSRVGTTGYRSPEYLRNGISHPSDDIYALGVTLYYILCDRLPYQIPGGHQSHFEMLMTPPPAPHLTNPHADRQLSAICLCAMASEREKRYTSAERMAADLQRWLDGETVSVYRMNRQEKLFHFLRKNATQIGIALAAIAGFLVGFFVKAGM